MNSEQSAPTEHDPVASEHPSPPSTKTQESQPTGETSEGASEAADPVKQSLPDASTPPAETPEPSVTASEPESSVPETPVVEAAGSEEAPAETSPPVEAAPVVEETAQAAPASETPARPRVQLNPTVDPEQAKAIPSPTLSAPPTASSEGDDVLDAAADAQSTAAMFAPPVSSEPVQLPPANEELGADIEAELAAALSGEEATAPAAEPVIAGAEQISEEDIEAGTKLKGRVQSIQKDNILLDVGFRASAMVSLRQFEGRKQPLLGQELEVVVDRYDADDGLLLASLPRMARSAGNWDEVAVDQIVDCLVKKANKGGLEVSVSNLRGFMPASQVDLGFVESLEGYVGQKLKAKIIEVKPEKRNLVVSRRAYLQDERDEVAKDLWQSLEVGQTHPGKVKTIKDYGAFVDIGGIDGLLHVAELSWTRVNHPRDILTLGQEIEVQIVGVDQDKKKISLSVKQLKKDPWNDCVDRFPVESVVRGKVSNIANFGAFVEIEEGVEGLIHISELDYRRINKVTDVLSPGEEVEAKVVSIDPERKRIGLSLKALKTKPEPVAKPKDEDLSPSGGEAYQRKRKGPLKGGTGSGSGPLFG